MSVAPELENGVQQGFVLSPTLFNLSINDITKEIAPPVKCSHFADDFIIFVSVHDITQDEKLLQKLLTNCKTGLNKMVSTSPL